MNCARVQAQTALREGHRQYKDESFRKALDSYKYVLEKDPANPKYILTVWGVGYVFAERGPPQR